MARSIDRALTQKEIKQLAAVIAEVRRANLNLPKGERPFYDPQRDGVTYSLLSGFRQCKELARLNLKGVTSRGDSESLVFGNLSHGALEAIYDAVRTKRLRRAVPDARYAKDVLQVMETTWKRDNPRATRESLQYLEKSMALAEAVLPRYLSYWAGDFTGGVRWLALESEFKIPITVSVPWGPPIKTFVRGKMDGNFIESARKWLFETKTKGFIDEEMIASILPHELQVNVYLWAMRRIYKEVPAGVRYNLIRRPQLRQKKSENFHQFTVRVAEDVVARPEFYFIRMDMDVTKHDLYKFEEEFDELLIDFLSWWYGHGSHYKNSGNCRTPWGKCHFLALCGRRDTVPFYKRATVFRELEEV